MTILLFFLFLSYFFPYLFIIPVVKENIKVKLALAIPAGIPITLVKEIILIPPIAADKTIKSYQYNQKQQCIYLVVYSLSFFLGFQN